MRDHGVALRQTEQLYSEHESPGLYLPGSCDKHEVQFPSLQFARGMACRTSESLLQLPNVARR